MGVIWNGHYLRHCTGITFFICRRGDDQFLCRSEGVAPAGLFVTSRKGRRIAVPRWLPGIGLGKNQFLRGGEGIAGSGSSVAARSAVMFQTLQNQESNNEIVGHVDPARRQRRKPEWVRTDRSWPVFGRRAAAWRRTDRRIRRRGRPLEIGRTADCGGRAECRSGAQATNLRPNPIPTARSKSTKSASRTASAMRPNLRSLLKSTDTALPRTATKGNRAAGSAAAWPAPAAFRARTRRPRSGPRGWRRRLRSFCTWTWNRNGKVNTKPASHEGHVKKTR